jgi:hypothetical protein
VVDIRGRFDALRRSLEASGRREALADLIRRLEEAGQQAPDPGSRSTYTHTVEQLHDALTALPKLIDATEAHHLGNAECMDSFVWNPLTEGIERLERQLPELEAALRKPIDSASREGAGASLRTYDDKLREIESTLVKGRDAESWNAAREERASALIDAFFKEVVQKPEFEFKKRAALELIAAAVGAVPTWGTIVDVANRVTDIRERVNEGYKATRDHMGYIKDLGEAAESWSATCEGLIERLENATPGDDC